MSDQPRTKLTLQPKRRNDGRSKWEERYQLISWWDSETMAKAKVLVVGAGALGNEVLKNLALLNIGNLFIVDFDKVEYSNLSRSVLFRSTDTQKESFKAFVAAERIREINPNIKVQAANGDIIYDIGLGVFRRMDVVIGCLDNRVARLYINRHCFKVGKPWIDGALEDIAGELYVYQPYGSCYECQLTKKELKNIQYRLSCADIAARNATAGRIPTTPITASVIGAMQAQEALKLIHGFDNRTLAGFKYYGLANQFFTFEDDEVNEDCLTTHHPVGEIHEIKDLSCKNTVKGALEILQDHFGSPDISIDLDYDIVQKLVGMTTDRHHEVFIPRFRMTDEFLQTFKATPDEQIGILTSENINHLDKSFPRMEATLESIGVPPLQILAITVDQKETHLVELTGDENYLTF